MAKLHGPLVSPNHVTPLSSRAPISDSPDSFAPARNFDVGMMSGYDALEMATMGGASSLTVGAR